VGSVILRTTYGYEATDGKSDPYILLAHQNLQEASDVGTPGNYVVNVFPSLQLLPHWFPGTGRFRMAVKRRTATLAKTVSLPFEATKERISLGTAVPSFVSDLLMLGESSEDDIRWAAHAMYLAGSDTTASLITAFFLAMTLYPDVQRKAQSEIDSIIGGSPGVGVERLPSLADRDKLPYLFALMKEIIRFYPVAPLGQPHIATYDDVYQGFRIPKNAILIRNVWKMFHDPDTYSNPSEFNPERYLPGDGKESEQDPRDLAFGLGKRTCPGRLFGETTFYLTCAMTLATFNISKAKVKLPDGTYTDVEPKVEFVSSFVTQPYPFQCEILPRSAQAATFIRSLEGQTE